jgi:hypothetical protein
MKQCICGLLRLFARLADGRKPQFKRRFVDPE